MSTPADLLHPATLADPYPLYHDLQENAPVCWDGQLGRWVITRYADVAAVLHDPRTRAESFYLDGIPYAYQAEVGPLYRVLARQMLFLDPPDQLRLRRLIAQSFTPSALQGMRRRIAEITESLLRAMPGRGGLDIIADFASPLPALVIAELLGVPISDRDQFQRWSDALAAFLNGAFESWEEIRPSLPSLYQLMDYLCGIIDEARVHPRDDLLGMMVTAEDRGDILSEDELLGNCLLILAAGQETTTNLIGNGLLALLRHPDQWRLLQRNHRLLPDAVEEALRFESPVQWTTRRLDAGMELGGQRLGAGQSVLLGLGAANRDPREFSDPDRLDITRSESRHIAFGYGHHFCLGAALARMEGQAAFEALLTRFPDLRLASEEVAWQPNFAFRALQALPVLV